MSLHSRAIQLERHLKKQLKPMDVFFVVNMNPCYECEGCEKCASYHKEKGAPIEGKTIVVEGDQEEDC